MGGCLFLFCCLRFILFALTYHSGKNENTTKYDTKYAMKLFLQYFFQELPRVALFYFRHFFGGALAYDRAAVVAAFRA